jgi:hypothetical protein
MQTSLLLLVSGIHRVIPKNEAVIGPYSGKGTTMAKTAAIGFAPNTPLFARLVAAIDRALMASARISLRNGDLPRFGL